MPRRNWIAGVLLAISCLNGGVAASAGDWHGSGWHGSGWLGSSWGLWSDGFQRDPIIGVYGPFNLDFDPYASYRNDNGCFRVLPVQTRAGLRLRRVFVCDF
jgi:hypothetical protein